MRGGARSSGDPSFELRGPQPELPNSGRVGERLLLLHA